MNLHNFIPEKIINKAPHAIAWLVQTVFAAALPDVYQKMPQHLIVTYLGFTPENINRLKYIAPTLIAAFIHYKQQIFSHFANGVLYRQNELKCCSGH